MLEKQVKKKEIQEFKNFSDLIHFSNETKHLPSIFIYCSEDSFEFDMITEIYREAFKKKNEIFEVIVYVAETGDFGKLYSEIFNLSMFASNKLLIIRSGVDFFKPILQVGKKEEFDSFQKNILNMPETISLVLHYDAKEVPAKLGNLFQNKYAILKNRNLYMDERYPTLDTILRNEKVNFDTEAKDEFIHRTVPNSGAYTKSIRKLKNVLFKKDFTLIDIELVLFNSSEFNPFFAVDHLFKNSKSDFFKELSKLKEGSEGSAQYLAFFNILLKRVDEVRKATFLFQRFKNQNSDAEFFTLLGFASYSDGRKKFVKSRLQKEVRLFNRSILKTLYKTLIELNIQSKTSSVPINKFYLSKVFETLFFTLSQST